MKLLYRPRIALRTLLRALLLTIVVAPCPTFAATKKPATATIPAVDSGPVDAARTQLSTDRQALTKAQGQLDTVVRELETTWASQSDVAAAKAGTQSAQQEFSAASGPILAALQEKPAYRQAVADREAAEKKMAVLRSGEGSGTVDANENLLTADAALQARKAVTQMEEDAVAANPAAKAARKKLTDAGNAYSTLRMKFEASIKGNSNWRAAHKDVADAKKKVEQDERTLSAAEKKYADDVAAHDSAVAKQKQAEAQAAGGGRKKGSHKRG